MTKMPAMGRSKAVRPCVCGCGQTTKSTWFPGHDGRATGWAIRIERGAMRIEDVPANERAGAEYRMRQRGTWDAYVATFAAKQQVA